MTCIFLPLSEVGVPKYPQVFWNTPRCSEISPSVLKYPQVFWNIPKFFEISPSVPKLGLCKFYISLTHATEQRLYFLPPPLPRRAIFVWTQLASNEEWRRRAMQVVKSTSLSCWRVCAASCRTMVRAQTPRRGRRGTWGLTHDLARLSPSATSTSAQEAAKSCRMPWVVSYPTSELL